MKRITWYGFGIRMVGQHRWEAGDIVEIEDSLALDLMTQPDRAGFKDEFIEVTVTTVSGVGPVHEAELVKAGVPTVEALAGLGEERLGQVAGRISLSLDELQKVIRRAQAMLVKSSGKSGSVKSQSIRVKAAAEPAPEPDSEATEE